MSLLVGVSLPALVSRAQAAKITHAGNTVVDLAMLAR